MSALPHLPNFLTALFSGCLLSYAPLEVLGTPPPSFRVSRGYFLLSSILIFTYLLWHPRVPSSSHPVSLSFLFVLLRVRCLYSFPSFSPGCFFTFYLLLPERCFFSHSLRPPHNTSCFYSFGCDFPYSEPSQAPFPLFQSILPDLAVIFISECLRVSGGGGGGGSQQLCFPRRALHFRTFPSAPACFLTEVVFYT